MTGDISHGPDPVRSDGQALSGRKRAQLLVILVLFIFLAYIDRQIIYLLVDPIKHDLGLSDTQIGLLSGMAFAIFYGFCTIPLGALADRGNRRLITLIAVSFWGTASAACGLAAAFVPLLLARVAVGLGEAGYLPAAYSLVADAVPPRRLGVATAVLQAAGSLGNGFALIGGGLLIGMLVREGGIVVPLLGALAPWQAAFILTGLPGPLLAWLIYMVPDPGRADIGSAATHPTTAALIQLILKQGRFYAGCFFGIGFMTMSSISVNVWGPAYVGRIFHWGPAIAGPLIGSIQLAAVMTSVFVTGWAVDFFYRRGQADIHLKWAAISAWLAAPFGVIAFLTREPSWFITCYMLFFLISSGQTSAIGAALQIATPGRYRGRVYGVYLLCITLFGAGLGPLLTGYLTDHLFGDELELGHALAVMVLAMPIGGLIAHYGSGAASQILKQRESGRDQHVQ
jgi:MFS family permease